MGALLLAVGCTRTVTGGFEDSPDKKYRCYGRVFGAYGRSFIEDTAKTVRISIVKNDTSETLLLRKEFAVNGADVTWDAIWEGQSSLQIIISDYGPGVSFYGPEKDAPPKRHIKTARFAFDAKTGEFSEQPGS
jgi:hypothetical protein